MTEARDRTRRRHGRRATMLTMAVALVAAVLLAAPAGRAAPAGCD